MTKSDHISMNSGQPDSVDVSMFCVPLLQFVIKCDPWWWTTLICRPMICICVHVSCSCTVVPPKGRNSSVVVVLDCF